MIDAYAYTDADGNTLTVMALSATTNNPPHVQFAARNPAGVMSVWVPPTEVQDVIAGILSQSAAAQGRTWGSALAQARDDLTLYSTPRNGPGLVDVTMTDAFEALNRLMDQHMPLLLALAEAYTGQDGELWQQYRRVQAERDQALSEARRHARDLVVARGALHRANTRTTIPLLEDIADEADVIAEVEQLRARVAELEHALAAAQAELVGALYASTPQRVVIGDSQIDETHVHTRAYLDAVLATAPDASHQSSVTVAT